MGGGFGLLFLFGKCLAAPLWDNSISERLIYICWEKPDLCGQERAESPYPAAQTRHYSTQNQSYFPHIPHHHVPFVFAPATLSIYIWVTIEEEALIGAFFIGLKRVTAIRREISGLMPAPRGLMGRNAASHLGGIRPFSGREISIGGSRQRPTKRKTSFFVTPKPLFEHCHAHIPSHKTRRPIGTPHTVARPFRPVSSRQKQKRRRFVTRARLIITNFATITDRRPPGADHCRRHGRAAVHKLNNFYLWYSTSFG